MKVSYLSVVAKDGLTAAQRFAAMTKAAGTFYIVGSDLYFEDKKVTNGSDLSQIVSDIGDINTTLATLQDEENVPGSIKAIIKSYLEAENVSITDSDGIFTATNVEDALTELAGMITDANTANEVTCVKSTGGANDDFVYVYTFYQGSDPIPNGEITIGKDMVATTGELVNPTVGDPIQIGNETITSGTYIMMTIANGTPFYINVTDLIEYNTFTNTAANGEIVVTDNNHSITMAVGKISATKIIYREADDSDPQNPITEQTVAQAINALQSATTGLLDNLDADIDATGTAQHSGTFVVSGITEVDGVITSVDSVEVEAAGAAAAVLGESTDTASAATVYGAKAAASDAQTDVDNLELYVGTLPNGATATDVVGYIDEAAGAAVDNVSGSATIASVSSNVVTLKAGVTQTSAAIANSTDSDIVLAKAAKTGAAEDIGITDADGLFTATNVEDALAELVESMTWNEV